MDPEGNEEGDGMSRDVLQDRKIKVIGVEERKSSR